MYLLFSISRYSSMFEYTHTTMENNKMKTPTIKIMNPFIAIDDACLIDIHSVPECSSIDNETLSPIA